MVGPRTDRPRTNIPRTDGGRTGPQTPDGQTLDRVTQTDGPWTDGRRTQRTVTKVGNLNYIVNLRTSRNKPILRIAVFDKQSIY